MDQTGQGGDVRAGEASPALFAEDREPLAGGWEKRRPVPYVRALRTTLRTAHLIAFGVLYGGHVFDVSPARLRIGLVATAATGAVLMGMEIYRAPIWLVQVRGVATLVKIVLTVSVAVFWSFRIAILTSVIVIGSVSSHMPGQYRYYSLLHRRVMDERESG